MLNWLKRMLGSEDDDEQNEQGGIKNFDDATADIQGKQYERTGQASISTDKIVGSVGRAHELDENFRYRRRRDTGRYHYIEEANREGKPSDPIKVLRVKRDRAQSEYYVLDGHHRVAQAKKFHYPEVNADVTNVTGNSEMPIETDDEDNAEN